MTISNTLPTNYSEIYIVTLDLKLDVKCLS